ncbi:MAG: hypothetical protein Q7T73_18855 [Beijerinckiaceae bacterium]|nr:hypothetical protein [Beijerinckiaceae bacterium]
MIRIMILGSTLALAGCNAGLATRAEPPVMDAPVQSEVATPASNLPDLDCRPASGSGGITC